MALHRDRLTVRLFKIIEGEAEGRFAITALMLITFLAIIFIATIRYAHAL
jgi:hypothetical protein